MKRLLTGVGIGMFGLGIIALPMGLSYDTLNESIKNGKKLKQQQEQLHRLQAQFVNITPRTTVPQDHYQKINNNGYP